MPRKSEENKEEDGFRGRFLRLRKHFTRRPESALRTLYSDVVSMDGYHSTAMSDKFKVEADEPEGLGGTDMAPTPTLLLLSAMAHCQAITMRMYADAMGVVLDDVKVKVTGTVDLRGYFSVLDDKDCLYSSGLEEIVIKTNIESREPKDRLKALVKAAHGRGVCLTSVKPKRPIDFRYRLNGERLEVQR